MPDNLPETIAATIKRVIEGRRYERLAAVAAQQMYGPVTVQESLCGLFRQVATAASLTFQKTGRRNDAEPRVNSAKRMANFDRSLRGKARPQGLRHVESEQRGVTHGVAGGRQE